jgi:molybdopterin synthase catalytic subunit
MNDRVFARITSEPLAPEQIINLVRTRDSGCVVTYVGLIRNNSRGMEVAFVEYRDPGDAEQKLLSIINEAMRLFPLNSMAMHHRVGILDVNDINLVVAIGAGHREEGLEACRFAVDEFKSRLPTSKTETYIDGSTYPGHD